METKKEKAVRKFRGKAVISKLLLDQIQSGQSIKSYCAAHGISEGTFHNWKTRYKAEEEAKPTGFANLLVTRDSGLFAAVGSIKIYQPVSAAYLKDLLS